tara:strand:+ start:417 stop:590 length:174 start_codon:yes stop_codon:yes gene_type:complete
MVHIGLNSAAFFLIKTDRQNTTRSDFPAILGGIQANHNKCELCCEAYESKNAASAPL